MPTVCVRSLFLAFALFCAQLFQPLNVSSQTTEVWTPGAIPMGSQIGPGAAFPVIRGQPYTAEVLQQQTTVLTDGTKRVAEARNVHRRDSRGRLLDEKLPSPHVKIGEGEVFTQHGFVLVDPVGLSSSQWDDDTRTVVVSSIRAQQAQVDNFDRPCPASSGYATVEQQELGERIIHGAVAVGCRTTATTAGEHQIAVLIETWRSKALHIPLLTIEHQSNGAESRTEVIGLDLGEPDETKFEPPQQYKHMVGR